MSETTQDIFPEDVHVEPFLKYNGDVEIQAIRRADPNPETGHEMIYVTVSYPIGDPNPRTFEGSFFYNRERMAPGADNSDMTDGQRGWLNRNAAMYKNLVSFSGAASLNDTEGRVVGAIIGPRNDDPVRGEFKAFKKPKPRN